MRTKHLLKTDPATFQAVWEGRKTFEIRLNDRDFKVCDALELQETVHTGEQMRAGLPVEYTGRTLHRHVSHVLSGYGLLPNWVCLSFEPVWNLPTAPRGKIEVDQVLNALHRAHTALSSTADVLHERHDYSAEFPAADAERMLEAITLLSAPIDMILHCPACHVRHIDEPERSLGLENTERLDWDNPPHRSHLCHGCGHLWRPADVPTNGVNAITTRGKNDS